MLYTRVVREFDGPRLYLSWLNGTRRQNYLAGDVETRFKGLETKRRGRIKLVGIKLAGNRAARFPFWKLLSIGGTRHRGELSSDSIPRGIIRGNRAEIISPIEFFIGRIAAANCSRAARRPFKGWFASKPVDPSFTSRNCISHGTLPASLPPWWIGPFGARGSGSIEFAQDIDVAYIDASTPRVTAVAEREERTAGNSPRLLGFLPLLLRTCSGQGFYFLDRKLPASRYWPLSIFQAERILGKFTIGLS